MASIIKVDQIQTAAGGTPTAADLGINTTGTVLQVVDSIQTRYVSVTTTVWTTTAQLSITPKFADSKIIVIHSESGMGQGYGHSFGVRILRDSTPVKTCTRHGHINSGGNHWAPVTADMTAIDTPNTTSQITYYLQMATEGFEFRLGDIDIDIENTRINNSVFYAIEIAG